MYELSATSAVSMGCLLCVSDVCSVYRISTLMHARLSEDETELENISDTSRPSKVRELYQAITTEEWLAAKQLLDGHHTKHSSKHYVLLVDIMKVSSTLFLVSH